MPARFLLIDGYNLMHAAGMGRATYGPGDLQRCRERLLRFLLNKLTPAEVERATVVFDARDPPAGAASRQTISGLKVVFANPGGDADVLIQELLDEHSAPKRVLLVSSDHQLQRAARRHRAEFIDSEEFFDIQERRRGRKRADRSALPDPKAEGLSAGEAAHWENLFGQVAVNDLVEPDESSTINEEPPATGPAPAAEKSAEAKTGRKARRRRSGGKGGGTRKATRDRPEKPPQTEVEYWLQEFGDVAEASELAKTNGMSLKELEAWFEELKRQERKSGR